MPNTFPEYESFDGIGLANLIQKGMITPDELLEAAIERIELWNPKLNAVIYKMYDHARAALKATLPEGPFQGVPILLKDLLGDYKGTPISMGSRYAHDNQWISQADSELIKRLKKTGAQILGKTNVPEFGLSPVTEPEVFGPTHNPWNLERNSGGSSGGSAAAVAARIVPIAHASDGGGSIRIPSAYTGVFGFKPSRGRTPAGPLFMRVWLGYVVEHAITRTVRDSAAMLDALTGTEVGSPIALDKPNHSFSSQLDKPVPKLRIAMIEQPFFKAQVDPEYAQALKKAAQLCQDLGHHVEPAILPFDENIALAFLIVISAETKATVREMSKVINHKPKSHELEDATIMLCHAGVEFSAADLAWALQTLDMAGVNLATLLEKYDVIMTPVVPSAAPKIGGLKLDRNEQFVVKLLSYLPYGQTLVHLVQRVATKAFELMSFTALFNIGGQPAMSVPLYWDTKGMPIGIQFATKINQDALLFQLAKQLEDAQPWVDKKPSESVVEVEDVVTS